VTSDALVGRLLLDVAIIVAVAWVLAVALRRLRQPPVLGEIIGGILLGPTVLGALPGNPTATLFPANVRSALAVVGTVGLVIFMFMVGLELDLRVLRRSQRSVTAVSLGSLAVPLAFGFALAAIIYDSHHVVNGHAVDFAPFALFIMTALSITAFPVLARILADRGLQETKLGVVATASAAVQDGAGWLLLAISLAAFRATGPLGVLRIAAETAALAAVLVGLVRPLLRRLTASESQTVTTTTVVIVGLFASAAVTQLIGLHSVLGAFMFGLVFPRRERPLAASALRRSLSPVTMFVLLPVYFATPGLSVNLRALSAHGFAELGLIFVCACAAKLLGAGIGARVGGLGRRDAAQIAILMNTRGLIELIVLNVGLMAGVLDDKLFSEMVAMAVLTTMMTGPLLDLTRRRRGAPQPVSAGIDAPQPT
jgi:Kef-type K+ transport system membrane component KefB